MSYSKPETVQSIEEMTDQNVLYYLEPENLYYYWDPYAHSQNGKWIGEWASTTSANFGTVFEQTATGFKLKGNVALEGNLITSGTIEGCDICTQKTEASGVIPAGSYIRLKSGNHESGGNCIEFWYGDRVLLQMGLSSAGNGAYISATGNFPLRISGMVKAEGNWDFSGATVRLPGE